jgi:hypothetical protein
MIYSIILVLLLGLNMEVKNRSIDKLGYGDCFKYCYSSECYTVRTYFNTYKTRVGIVLEDSRDKYICAVKLGSYSEIVLETLYKHSEYYEYIKISCAELVRNFNHGFVYDAGLKAQIYKALKESYFCIDCDKIE